MKFDILTLFPEMCQTVMDESIIGRGQKAGVIQCTAYNIRNYSINKHRTVDDTPYGGGQGMLMSAEPIYLAYKDLCKNAVSKPHVIFMSPQGKAIDQEYVGHLSNTKDHIILLCGHYEGVDQRVIDEIVDEEVSFGDFVLTGGEIPALALVDAVARLVPGVLSSNESFMEESHYNGLLEYPHYTKPQEWREKKVPDVLLSGHHKNIEKWRREKSIDFTYKKRPDMIESAYKKGLLTEEDKFYLMSKYNMKL